MLRAAAAGNSVSKHDFSTALPDLRLGLLNAQQREKLQQAVMQ